MRELTTELPDEPPDLSRPGAALALWRLAKHLAGMEDEDATEPGDSDQRHPDHLVALAPATDHLGPLGGEAA